MQYNVAFGELLDRDEGQVEVEVEALIEPRFAGTEYEPPSAPEVELRTVKRTDNGVPVAVTEAERTRMRDEAVSVWEHEQGGW